MKSNLMRLYFPVDLTLSLPVTRICVNFSTVYNDRLVAKGLTGNLIMIKKLVLGGT